MGFVLFCFVFKVKNKHNKNVKENEYINKNNKQTKKHKSKWKFWNFNVVPKLRVKAKIANYFDMIVFAHTLYVYFIIYRTKFLLRFTLSLSFLEIICSSSSCYSILCILCWFCVCIFLPLPVVPVQQLVLHYLLFTLLLVNAIN